MKDGSFSSFKWPLCLYIPLVVFLHVIHEVISVCDQVSPESFVGFVPFLPPYRENFTGTWLRTSFLVLRTLFYFRLLWRSVSRSSFLKTVLYPNLSDLIDFSNIKRQYCNHGLSGLECRTRGGSCSTYLGRTRNNRHLIYCLFDGMSRLFLDILYYRHFTNCFTNQGSDVLMNGNNTGSDYTLRP